MIKTINGWRAVFALMIVLFHVGVMGLEEMTWAGVSFFLMASGFLLALKYPNQPAGGKSYWKFVGRHAMKLYPLHWLTLALWLGVMAVLGLLVIQPVTLALNVALLHPWSLLHSVYYSYNQFSWFLGTLLFCYVCYPLLSRWFTPLRLRTQALILAALIVIDFVLLAMMGGNDYYRTALYVFPPMRLIDFMIGMTLASAYPHAKGLRVLGKAQNGTDAELVALALLSAVVMTYRAYPGLLPWGDTTLWWLPVALIIAVCAIYNAREGFIGKVLASRPLQWLGDISFEIFMLQGLAALVFNYLVAPLLGHMGFGHPSPFDTPGNTDLFSIDPYTLIAWFILPIDILLAWVVNRLFTRPVRRLLR